jgi:hypothetical protein
LTLVAPACRTVRTVMPEFPHAPKSQLVCIPGENPVRLDLLRADLAAEHRPATPTEELLVDEMAQHYWRMKRYRYLETSMWMADESAADGKLSANLELVQWTISSGIAAHYQRCLASAERAFYRALNALRGIQKERGFVFSNPQSELAEPAAKPDTQTKAAASGSSGFVFTSENAGMESKLENNALQSGFVPAKSSAPTSQETPSIDNLASFLHRSSGEIDNSGFVFTSSNGRIAGD